MGGGGGRLLYLSARDLVSLPDALGFTGQSVLSAKAVPDVVVTGVKLEGLFLSVSVFSSHVFALKEVFIVFKVGSLKKVTLKCWLIIF